MFHVKHFGSDSNLPDWICIETLVTYVFTI